MNPGFEIPLAFEDPPVMNRNLVGRLLGRSEDLLKAYRLRHQVIVEELGWVQPQFTCDSLEFDSYDTGATHFGVFSDEEIVGYIRAIPGNDLDDFLLGKEFLPLIKGQELKINRHLHMHRHESIEISRLVVALAFRHTLDVPRLLYRILTEWAWRRNYEYWYMVVSPRIFDLFIFQGFVMEKLAMGEVMENGGKCIAARLYLKKTRQNIRKTLPEDHDWYFGLL